jgi:hypothetical protein
MENSSQIQNKDDKTKFSYIIYGSLTILGVSLSYLGLKLLKKYFYKKSNEEKKKDLLKSLIIKNRESYHVTYPLSNHLVSGLYAIIQLGTKESRIQEWFEHYSKRLKKCEELSNEVNITQDNFQQYIGKFKYYPEYLIFFKSEIDKNGLKDTVILK